MMSLRQFLDANPFFIDDKIVIKVEGAPVHIYKGTLSELSFYTVHIYGEYLIKRVDFPECMRGPQAVAVIELYNKEGS